MPKRRKRDVDEAYIRRDKIPARLEPPSLTALAFAVPAVIAKLDKSIIKQHQEKPDWSLYKLELRENNPFVVRVMCDRCGKVEVPPNWRKIRAVQTDNEELGVVYFETGLCKDCINASTYRDAFLDGDPLSFTEAGKLYHRYAEEYERAWRLVLSCAPSTPITEAEWQKACRFFNGCAICGGRIEIRAKYFPATLNGTHTAWNVIPMCSECHRYHQAGRGNFHEKKAVRYKVFSSPDNFNKQKTIRVYLLQQMRNHEVYMEPLYPYMKRFRETLTLEGSV